MSRFKSFLVLITIVAIIALPFYTLVGGFNGSAYVENDYIFSTSYLENNQASYDNGSIDDSTDILSNTSDLFLDSEEYLLDYAEHNEVTTYDERKITQDIEKNDVIIINKKEDKNIDINISTIEETKNESNVIIEEIPLGINMKINSSETLELNDNVLVSNIVENSVCENGIEEETQNVNIETYIPLAISLYDSTYSVSSYDYNNMIDNSSNNVDNIIGSSTLSQNNSLEYPFWILGETSVYSNETEKDEKIETSECVVERVDENILAYAGTSEIVLSFTEEIDSFDFEGEVENEEILFSEEEMLVDIDKKNEAVEEFVNNLLAANDENSDFALEDEVPLGLEMADEIGIVSYYDTENDVTTYELPIYYTYSDEDGNVHEDYTTFIITH